MIYMQPAKSARIKHTKMCGGFHPLLHLTEECNLPVHLELSKNIKYFAFVFTSAGESGFSNSDSTFSAVTGIGKIVSI